jgi:hypothetical protein
MPARLAAVLFAAWMAALGVVFSVTAEWQTQVRVAAAVTAAVAVEYGVRRHRPAHPGPWRLLSLAVLLSAAGTVLFADRGDGRMLSRAGDWLLLAVYLLIALVLSRFVRHRTGRVRDGGGVLDALTVTSGVTLLAWAYAIAPNLGGDVDRWAVIAFPAGDLLCLAMLIRLLTTLRRRLTAAGLLGAGILAMLIADIGFDLISLQGDLTMLGTFGRIPLYAAAGLAALHPSMAELTRPAAEGPSTDLGPVRLSLLATASLIAPAVLIIEVGRQPVAVLTVIGALSAVTFLLVLVRMAGIMASHRLALARERGLREASVALVSAADVEEVSDAVSLAVARLLPRRAPLTVVTHFLPIIRTLAAQPGIELIGLGGRFVPSYDSFLGQATAAAAAELQTDLLIMSTTAVTGGICYIQSQDTVVTRRVLIARAQRTVALLDHTKFARRALHRLVDLAELDRVVVDRDTPEHVVRDLRRRSVAVEVADEAV